LAAAEEDVTIRRAALFASLDAEFQRTVFEMGIPGVTTATIDPKSYLPLLSGGSFHSFSFGGGIITAVQVAYWTSLPAAAAGGVTRGLYWLVHDHEKTVYGENPRRAWTQVWSEMIETRAGDELRQLAPRLIGGGRAFFTEEHLMAAFPGSKNCDGPAVAALTPACRAGRHPEVASGLAAPGEGSLRRHRPETPRRRRQACSRRTVPARLVKPTLERRGTGGWCHESSSPPEGALALPEVLTDSSRLATRPYGGSHRRPRAGEYERASYNPRSALAAEWWSPAGCQSSVTVLEAARDGYVRQTARSRHHPP
jgi:hypothetical protein